MEKLRFVQKTKPMLRRVESEQEDLGVSSMIGMPVARMPRRATRFQSEREGTHNTKLEKLVQFTEEHRLLITCLVATWRVAITNCFQLVPTLRDRCPLRE